MDISRNELRVYGAERCRKTRFHIEFLQRRNLDFEFLDVEKNELAAVELSSLYTSNKLNFPTILIKGKKLRNPRIEELEKWLEKKGYQQ